MEKCLIAAVRPDGSLPPLYLAGYLDSGSGWTGRWTANRAHARFFDRDEAEVETQLVPREHLGLRILTREPIGASYQRP